MSALARYAKEAGERKRYQINYVNWLDTGEQALSATFTVNNNDVLNPVVVDGIAVIPGGLGVQYYMSGGNNGKTYSIYALLTTTVGPQRKLDEIILTVRQPQ